MTVQKKSKTSLPRTRAAGALRRGLARLATIAATLTCGWIAPALAGPLNDPRSDAFYTPPATLTGAPGTLIRSRPFFPLGLLASGWQIMYKSTDVNGNPIAVTGTVLVPLTPWFLGDRPIIAWAPGSQGQADNCAPSHQYAIGTEYELALGATPLTLARGWAIAMTDYPGQGTPGDQPYLVGKAAGQAVLDAVKAAQQLSVAGLSVSAPVGIMGYSQGGLASAWAAELQPAYAPHLNVKGVASGAGPGRIEGDFWTHINGGVFGGVLPALLIGMNAAYPELALDAILTPYGKYVVADARNIKCFVELVATYPFMSDTQLVNPPGILDRPDWEARVAQQRTGTSAPAVPALVFAGLADEVVPYQVTKQTFTDWCARGATVAFRTVAITDHIAGLAVGWPVALDWMASRFAGERAPSDCP